MDIIFNISVFIFGSIIGSFLNVVIYRLGTGASIVHGRSMCFSCGKTLAWYELLPIVSFIIQRGKCNTCKSKISWQYPTVEIITGTSFFLTWTLGVPIWEVVFYWVVIAILIVIAVYDMRHKIIPNSLVYAFIVLAFAQLVWTPNVQVWDWLAGPVLFLPFAGLWFVSRGTWMGFGDAKLAWGIGWFLGLYSGVSAVVLAFWIGAVWGLGLIALSHIKKLSPKRKLYRGMDMKSEIPFGPFLVLGVVLIFFFNIDIFSFNFIF